MKIDKIKITRCESYAYRSHALRYVYINIIERHFMCETYDSVCVWVSVSVIVDCVSGVWTTSRLKFQERALSVSYGYRMRFINFDNVRLNDKRRVLADRFALEYLILRWISEYDPQVSIPDTQIFDRDLNFFNTLYEIYVIYDFFL